MANHYGDFGELAEAVYSGNVARAEAVLDQMQRVSSERGRGEAIRAAKRRARPQPPAVAVAPSALRLPMPGHRPGSTLGLPKLKKSRTAA